MTGPVVVDDGVARRAVQPRGRVVDAIQRVQKLGDACGGAKVAAHEGGQLVAERHRRLPIAERDRMADDIVVLDHGRVAASGTPDELTRLVGGNVVTATIPASHIERLPGHPTPSGASPTATSLSRSASTTPTPPATSSPGSPTPWTPSTSPSRRPAWTTCSPTSHRQELPHDRRHPPADAETTRRSTPHTDLTVAFGGGTAALDLGSEWRFTARARCGRRCARSQRLSSSVTAASPETAASSSPG